MPFKPEQMTHDEILSDLKAKMNTIYNLVAEGRASAMLVWLEGENFESQFFVNAFHSRKGFLGGVGVLLDEALIDLENKQREAKQNKLVH